VALEKVLVKLFHVLKNTGLVPSVLSQICEMHVAGYKFVVLNNGFLTHHGWKFAGKFYAKKDSDNAHNWILFNYHFKVSNSF